MTPSLFEIQSRFSEILRSDNPDTGKLESIFSQCAASEVSLQTRLGIYRFAYFERIKESLAEDFPKLKAKLGNHDFDQLIRKYLENYPSQYPNLAQVGKDLPKFLAESSHYANQHTLQAELKELAEKEWAHCLCKWSESSQPMDFSKLLELSEEEQLQQSLVLAPSAQFLKGQVIFKVSLENSSPTLKTLELTPSMEKLLDEIRKSQSLGELTSFLENRSEPAPHAANPDAQSGDVLDAATTMTWISNWVAAGLITGYQPKNPF
ncbi:MAG: putative DNA-binding domain-containing protein [Bdellovibrionia bacterium]